MSAKGKKNRNRQDAGATADNRSVPASGRSHAGRKKVVPAKAGTQPENLGSGFRRNDGKRRPNRAHSAISKLPEEVQFQIREWLMPGPVKLTYDEVSARLEELGHKISRNQVFKFYAGLRYDMERMQKAQTRAEALVKYLVPKGSDVESAAVSLTNALCLEALSDADLISVQSIEDLAKVAHSLGRLQSSQVAREKWEHEKAKRIKEAVEALKKDLMMQLEGQPELTKSLLDLVYRAEERMLEKT